MKPTPAEAKIAERMAAGVLCRQGFLLGDGRNLRDVLDADGAAVEKLHLTHGAIASRLEEVLAAAIAALGVEVQIAGIGPARFGEAMGRIPCPWGGCGLFAKGEVELTDAAGGRIIRFTPLSVHMIARHGFYQGRRSRYRLEPGRLAKLFDIRADRE